MDWMRFDGALFRCLNDLEIVKAQRTAHIELRRVLPESRSIHSGFPGIVNAALTFATQGALALILEKNTTKGRSGFWWLHNTASKQISEYMPEETVINFLEQVTSDLMTLRNNTLFHISETTVKNPGALRRESNLTYAKLDQAIFVALETLRQTLVLRQASMTWTQGTRNVSTLEYDGSDIAELFRAI